MDTRTERITIRITPELRRDLQTLADGERRKLGEYLYLVLEDHVKAAQRPPKRS